MSFSLHAILSFTVTREGAPGETSLAGVGGDLTLRDLMAATGAASGSLVPGYGYRGSYSGIRFARWDHEEGRGLGHNDMWGGTGIRDLE